VNAEQMQSVYGLLYFDLVTLTLGNLKKDVHIFKTEIHIYL